MSVEHQNTTPEAVFSEATADSSAREDAVVLGFEELVGKLPNIHRQDRVTGEYEDLIGKRAFEIINDKEAGSIKVFSFTDRDEPKVIATMTTASGHQNGARFSYNRQMGPEKSASVLMKIAESLQESAK